MAVGEECTARGFWLSASSLAARRDVLRLRTDHRGLPRASGGLPDPHQYLPRDAVETSTSNQNSQATIRYHVRLSQPVMTQPVQTLGLEI